MQTTRKFACHTAPFDSRLISLSRPKHSLSWKIILYIEAKFPRGNFNLCHRQLAPHVLFVRTSLPQVSFELHSYTWISAIACTVGKLQAAGPGGQGDLLSVKWRRCVAAALSKSGDAGRLPTGIKQPGCDLRPCAGSGVIVVLRTWAQESSPPPKVAEGVLGGNRWAPRGAASLLQRWLHGRGGVHNPCR